MDPATGTLSRTKASRSLISSPQRRSTPNSAPTSFRSRASRNRPGLLAVNESSQLRITDIEAVPISIPSRGFNSALGQFATYEYGIVIVRTDAGIEGYGEISTLWDGASGVQCAFVEWAFRDALTGEDPLAINRCLKKMDTPFEGAWPARAAVEMALYDITGKALNTPTYALLGGRTRENIVLSRSLSMASPAEMATEARHVVEEGFTCVKVK